MSAHIIGRPNDGLLDILLGYGADPEQAFIGGREQSLKEGDGFEDQASEREAGGFPSEPQGPDLLADVLHGSRGSLPTGPTHR